MGLIETWKPVIGFPFYQVSSMGRVKSFARGVERILKPGLTSVGYPSVALGRGKTKLVHCLVAEAFIGPRPEGYDVCHIDGARNNNCVDNLRYDSRYENNKDRNYHGTLKLKLKDVREIREAVGTLASIASRFNVSITHVWKIRRGESWKYVN